MGRLKKNPENGILFSLKNGLMTRHIMNKPQKHYSKWKKQDTRDNILYISITIKWSEKANVWRQKDY